MENESISSPKVQTDKLKRLLQNSATSYQLFSRSLRALRSKFLALCFSDKVYAKGVRELKPRVSTLELSTWINTTTPKVLANACSVLTDLAPLSQGRNPGLEISEHLRCNPLRFGCVSAFFTSQR